jgi:hypothetical protein
MALNLGSVLRMPLKDQNLMLLAAGHAPAFAEQGRSGPNPKRSVDAALIQVIHHQNPLPALLLESSFRIAAANTAAETLFTFLLDAPRDSDDLGRLMFDAGGVSRHLENLDEVVAWTDRHQRAQRILNLTPGQTLPSTPVSMRREPVTPDGPALTLRFRKDGIRLALYTLLATLGTPLDLGAERLSLEFFLAADEPTEAWFRAQALRQVQ